MTSETGEKPKRQGFREGFGALQYVGLAAAALFAALVCMSLGSVRIPLSETVSCVWCALTKRPFPDEAIGAILLSVRIPRVLCAALTGASLSLCGAAMQGLLRNPLADGSTLGVSAGASLGAVIAIALCASIPSFPLSATVVYAMAFAFASLLLTLALAYRLDRTLSSNTIILLGIVGSMFASSLTSLVVTFASSHAKTILFWTMGSLSGASYPDARVLFAALVVGGGVLLALTRELNAFAIGEDNARHVGVPVRGVKIAVLAACSVLVGSCVAVGGTIGFVGLVVPHATRFLTGPNHRRLLPACVFSGATFLMLCDLAARTMLAPRELPIGVVTSLVGAAAFVWIFARARKARGTV